MYYHEDQNAHLAAGISLEQLINALTKPGEQFQFPVKSIPVGLDKQSRDTILATGAILGFSAIVVAAILKNR
jgi:hypothetical protein